MCTPIVQCINRFGERGKGVATLDKFNDWLHAVMAEPGFTGSDKAVLAYIAVFYVRHAEDTFCVKQSTIAERCAISRKAVNSAMSRAKHAGFLKVNRERQRGTGRHGADELRLTLPGLINESSHHSEELSNELPHHSRDSSEAIASCQTQSDVTKPPELCNQNAPSDVTKSPELCNRAKPPTSENNTPTGLNTGLTTGFEARVLRALDGDPLDGEAIEAEIVEPPAQDIARMFGGLFHATPVLPVTRRLTAPAESDPPESRRCPRCGEAGDEGEFEDERGNLVVCRHGRRGGGW